MEENKIKENMEGKHKKNKWLIWVSLRIGFIVMIIASLVAGQIEGMSFFLATILIVSIIFTFVISIMHLKKYYYKTFPIIALIISSIFIIAFVFGFIAPIEQDSFSSSVEQQSNITIDRDCVEISNGIMSCDGQGITNEQECKEVCLEENGLINTNYITNMSVDSENLGFVTFNGCYCYDDYDNVKYMYIVPIK